MGEVKRSMTGVNICALSLVLKRFACTDEKKKDGKKFMSRHFLK